MGARESNNYTDPTHRPHGFHDFSAILRYANVVNYGGELYSEI